MGNAFTAFALGIAFEKLTDLEKQHNKDRLGKLGLGTWQKTDAECPNSGDGHKEMFVESLAMCQSLSGFLERVETDNQIRDQIDKKQLPGRQVATFLNDNCSNQQNYRDSNSDDLLFQATLVMVVFMFTASMFVVMMIVFMMMLMFV
jgi:hypothetical protein